MPSPNPLSLPSLSQKQERRGGVVEVQRHH